MGAWYQGSSVVCQSQPLELMHHSPSYAGSHGSHALFVRFIVGLTNSVGLGQMVAHLEAVNK